MATGMCANPAIGKGGVGPNWKPGAEWCSAAPSLPEAACEFKHVPMRKWLGWEDSNLRLPDPVSWYVAN